MSAVPERDLARIVLAVIAIGALMASTLWILQPFLGAIIWAIMIVVATWPVMLRVQRAAGGRRWVAVAVMSFLLLLVLIVPMTAAIATVVAHVDDMVAWVKDLREFKLPPAPSWLAGLPMVGERLARGWDEVAVQGMAVLATRIQPYAGALTAWFVAQLGNFGALFLQFVLTIVAAAILYADGETVADWTLRGDLRMLAFPRRRAPRPVSTGD